MSKIVYNGCYGGFGLSDEAKKIYAVREFGDSNHEVWDWEISRDDPILVEIVETLGRKAGCDYSDLKIEELEAGTLWRIDEYDGMESVATMDSYEWKIAK